MFQCDAMGKVFITCTVPYQTLTLPKLGKQLPGEDCAEIRPAEKRASPDSPTDRCWPEWVESLAPLGFAWGVKVPEAVGIDFPWRATG